MLLAGLFGAGGLGHRRGLWLVPLAAAVLTIAACGGGGGGSAGPQTETFTAAVADVTVMGDSTGHVLDVRASGVEGATVTVSE